MFTGKKLSPELTAILQPLANRYSATLDGDGGNKHRSSQVNQTIRAEVAERLDFKADLRSKLLADGNVNVLEEDNRSFGSIRAVKFKIHNENGAPSGKIYRIFFKPPVGVGAGAGAIVTALGESMQAYMLAARQGAGTDIVHISDVKLHKNDWIKQNADCDKTHNECMDKTPIGWMESARIIANFIYGNEQHMKIRGNKFEFHRGSEFTKNIYKCLKNARDVTGIKMNDDKWNPADIWAVKKGFDEGIYAPGKWIGKEIPDLNAQLERDFDAGNLYGISLKKVEEGKHAKSSLINDSKTESINKIHWTGFKGDDIAHTQFVYITFNVNGNDGQLKFRKGGEGHQGEIDRIAGSSKAALHGKVGIYQDFCLKAFKDANLLMGGTSKKIEAGKFILKSNGRQIATVMTKLGNGSKMTPEETMQAGVITSNIEVFFKRLGKTVDGEQWCTQHGKQQGDSSYSKFLGLQTISMISLLNKQQKDKLTTQLTTYAMSQVPGLSCIHVKIQ